MKHTLQLLFFASLFLANSLEAQIHEIEILPDGVIVSRIDHTMIANPQEGQFVYDHNTKSYWLYDSQAWKEQKGNPNFFYSDLATGITLMGENAGLADFPDIGIQSSALGVSSSQLALDAINNTHLGGFTGMNNEYGLSNTLIGTAAGLELANGRSNIAIGFKSGYRLAATNFNLLIGNDAGFEMNNGEYNLAIGHQALEQNKDHSGTVAIGNHALQFNGMPLASPYGTLPNLNIAIGYNAAMNNAVGSEITAIGSRALENAQIGFKTSSFGFESGHDSQQGSLVSFGSEAGKYSNPIVNNLLFGSSAGKVSGSAYHNTIIGAFAGRDNFDGIANTFIGTYTGVLNNGNENVFVGYAAGSSNNGSHNIFIGNQSGLTNTQSNHLIIDNADTTEPLIEGDFSVGDKSVTINASCSIAQLLNLTPSLLSPANPNKGDIYMHDNSVQVELRYYDGAQWISL